jgi:5-methylcytosine-specific restriction endonuclease McrBC regulatory subunit McrC
MQKWILNKVFDIKPLPKIRSFSGHFFRIIISSTDKSILIKDEAEMSKFFVREWGELISKFDGFIKKFHGFLPNSLRTKVRSFASKSTTSDMVINKKSAEIIKTAKLTTGMKLPIVNNKINVVGRGIVHLESDKEFIKI